MPDQGDIVLIPVPIHWIAFALCCKILLQNRHDLDNKRFPSIDISGEPVTLPPRGAARRHRVGNGR